MAFRSSATTTQGAGISADLVATMPAGVASGDQLIALTTWDGFNTSVTPPADWNLLDFHSNSAPDGQTIVLWTKVATGSEGATQTWSAQTKAVVGIIAAWSGRSSTPLTSSEVVKTNNTSSNASPISVSLTGITASTSDDIAVFIGLDNPSSSQWSFSQITNYTNQATGNSGDFAVGNFQYRNNVSSGATGSLATTATRDSGTGNAGWGGFVIRIPVAGGATTTLQPSQATLTLQGRASGNVTALTPATAALSLAGKLPGTSAFTNVRIREVLVNGSGQLVSSATDIGLRVWYSGICAGPPDVSLNGMTTDANGTTSWSIATGTLSFNQPIFYVAQNSVSYSHYACGRLVPSYE